MATLSLFFKKKKKRRLKKKKKITDRTDQKWKVNCFCLGTVGLEEIRLQTAAKDALDGHISDGLTPFSGVKSRVNRYVLQLWQSKWDEFLEN